MPHTQFGGIPPNWYVGKLCPKRDINLIYMHLKVDGISLLWSKEWSDPNQIDYAGRPIIFLFLLLYIDTIGFESIMSVL